MDSNTTRRNRKPVVLYLPLDLAKRLEEVAERRNMSYNDIGRLALMDFLDDDDRKEKRRREQQEGRRRPKK